MKNKNAIFMARMAALALLFSVGLAACGGKKAEAQPGAGAADVRAVSGALAALKKGDAAAIAAAIKGKTAAELAALFESEYVSPGGDFMYALNETDDGIIIKSYTGTSSILVIPPAIEGYPVVQVGLFEHQGDYSERSHFVAKAAAISALIIPEGVQIIGELGQDDKLNKTVETIVLPSTLTTIGDGAFKYFKKITGFDLSHCAGLTEIGEWAFFGCSNLESVKLPDGLKVIGNNAFYGNNKLTSIKLPDSVQVIGEKAFEDCDKLTDANIPANIQIIGKTAFSGCTELFNLTIPDSITAIRFAEWGKISGTYPNEVFGWEDPYSPEDTDVFKGGTKLPLAVRKRLVDLGYQGKF
jgi:hypothetical protein